MREDDGPRGVLAEQLLDDVTLRQVLFDLSQCELFQLGDAILNVTSVPILGDRWQTVTLSASL